MQDVSFVIPGDPQPKQRPRFTRNGRTYTSKRTADAEEAIRQIARQLFPEPHTAPCGVELVFWCKTRRRTDADNLAKLFLDACNGIAYTDDYLIEELRIHLHRAVAGEEPRTDVLVYTLDEEAAVAA